MFLINGLIKCSDIDYRTNSFNIYHDFGFVKSSTKSFSFEYNGKIEQFRPANVSFHDGYIKVSIGTYRFNEKGIIRYSFSAFNVISINRKFTSEELFAKLKIIETSILFAKVKIKQAIPENVVIMSDIKFGEIQNNKTPMFYWESPSANDENAEDDTIKIVGYYYAFNNNPNYNVTRTDTYIKESPNNNVYVVFPSSGVYYFHIRAINSVGEISRDTSHAVVIYNDPPSVPKNLKINGHSYYSGASNYNIFSWKPSTNSDGDAIDYEISIYKNNELFYNDRITALRCYESMLFINFNVTFTDSFLFSKMMVKHKIGTLLTGRIKITEDSNSVSDSFSYPEPVYSNSDSIVEQIDSGYFTDIMSKKRYTDMLYFIYNKNISKNLSGNYYYKIRAYDWAEQSKWSDICYYDISDKDIRFFSRLNVGYNFEEDFGRKPIFGKLFIKGHDWFDGLMYIIPNLFIKLNICQAHTSEPLYSTLKFKYYESLYGAINIDTNFSDMYGRLKITWVPSTSILIPIVNKMYSSEDSLDIDFKISDNDYKDICGEMYIIANGSSGINGSVGIIRELLFNNMFIYRNFSYDNNYEKSKLLCKMIVDNYPSEPRVTCSEGHDWQSNNIVTFYWTVVDENIKTIAFEYILSSKKIDDFSNISFTRTVSNEKTFNLLNYEEDNEYYFYIRSVGNNGSFSNVVSYVVRYNNIPSRPWYPMFVNDIDCIDNIPVISRSENNVFKWQKSNHIDNDIVKYNLQISKKSDFSSLIVDVDDIYDISDKKDIYTTIKYNYDSDYSIYYWRVRAYDRFQYSDYGPVGRFKCNTRPSVPTNLSVSNGV